MSPEKVEILKGKSLLTYRISALIAGIAIAYFQYHSSGKQDSIESKLDRIEFRLEQTVKMQDKIESRVNSDEIEYRSGDAKIRSEIDYIKDNYIFNNPYFKSQKTNNENP